MSIIRFNKVNILNTELTYIYKREANGIKNELWTTTTTNRHHASLIHQFQLQCFSFHFNSMHQLHMLPFFLDPVFNRGTEWMICVCVCKCILYNTFPRQIHFCGVDLATVEWWVRVMLWVVSHLNKSYASCKSKPSKNCFALSLALLLWITVNNYYPCVRRRNNDIFLKPVIYHSCLPWIVGLI